MSTAKFNVQSRQVSLRHLLFKVIEQAESQAHIKEVHSHLHNSDAKPSSI